MNSISQFWHCTTSDKVTDSWQVHTTTLQQHVIYERYYLLTCCIACCLQHRACSFENKCDFEIWMIITFILLLISTRLIYCPWICRNIIYFNIFLVLHVQRSYALSTMTCIFVTNPIWRTSDSVVRKWWIRCLRFLSLWTFCASFVHVERLWILADRVSIAVYIFYFGNIVFSTTKLTELSMYCAM